MVFIPPREIQVCAELLSCRSSKLHYLSAVNRVDVLPAADPVAQLHRCFCRKLLERAVHTLIQPQSDSQADQRTSDSG